MKFLSLSVQGFRNFELLRVSLDGSSHFVVGKNGQGKTNFLEALNLATATRSFRTPSTRSLVGWNTPGKEARLLFKIKRDLGDVETLEIQLKSGAKRVLIDNEPVKVMKDFLGRYPTVALSSEDIQLLRGSPQLRRRFTDLAISSVDGEYFHALRSYHKGLLDRNALLKKGTSSSLLNAFDQPMISLAHQLIQKREAFFQWFQPVFEERYKIIGGEEKPEILYRPNFKPNEDFSYGDQLRKTREQDLRMKTTTSGPHRDDFKFGHKEHVAKDFASEGQQRGLVLALRLTQILWSEKQTGCKPVVLADDILGELDPIRRAGFWKALGNDYQLFASGTVKPIERTERDWVFWQMADGIIQMEQPDV